MKRYSRHHVIAISRERKQGKRVFSQRDCFCKTCRGNTVLLPERFHNAYHTLFFNLTPTETIEFILWLNSEMWSRQKITQSMIDNQFKLIKGER